MILVAIMLGSGALMMGRVTTQSRNAPVKQRRVETTQRELTALRIALERFRKDCGRYPTDKEGFKGLLGNPGGVAGWDGYYITLLRSDPWRHPYIYRLDGDAPLLLSVGADGVEGTSDDIHPVSLSPEAISAYLVKTNGGWSSPSENPAGVGIQR
jgi:general secretion pathway protein G